MVSSFVSPLHNIFEATENEGKQNPKRIVKTATGTKGVCFSRKGAERG